MFKTEWLSGRIKQLAECETHLSPNFNCKGVGLRKNTHASYLRPLTERTIHTRMPSRPPRKPRWVGRQGGTAVYEVFGFGVAADGSWAKRIRARRHKSDAHIIRRDWLCPVEPRRILFRLKGRCRRQLRLYAIFVRT